MLGRMDVWFVHIAIDLPRKQYIAAERSNNEKRFIRGIG